VALHDLTSGNSAGTLDCPVHKAIDLISHKWTALILHHLSQAGGTLRFRQLQRRVKPITQKELTKRLRELEGRGIVNREVFAEVPPRVDYHLIEMGKALIPLIKALGEWARKYELTNGGQMR
jgi:DNA-binding HxlR family transcriptional regulator